MTYFLRRFSRTPSDVLCSLAAPLSHDSAGGGGRQMALLDWFRKRTQAAPLGVANYYDYAYNIGLWRVIL